MISKNLKNICKDDICLIQNYDKAINDQTQTWECHHILETDLNMSRQQLIDIKRYYNVPASELIFLTRDEHNKIHRTGKRHSEKTKKKMSKPKSEETKRKLSEAAKKRTKYPMQGKHHSEETKKKQSDIMKGKYKGENNPMYGKPGANR